MTTSEVLSVLLAAASGLSGAGMGYGLTLGRIRTIERDVERLERTSASKEGLDALKSSLDGLRTDIDRRFDQLEKLLISKKDA